MLPLVRHSLPSFGIDGRAVRFLRQPCDFHDALLTGIRHAQRRIVLMSLYLGTGAHEREIVAMLRESLEQKHDLHVRIVLDFQRGSRGGPDKSSVGLLAPLKKAFRDRFHLNLYHTSNLNGIAKHILPDRFNEIPGLFHVKAYVFDDDLLISGANLSDSYFTNRQDRYALLSNLPSVTDYFSDLGETIGGISYTLHTNMVFVPPKVEPHKYPSAFVSFARSQLHDFFEAQRTIAQAKLKDTQTSTTFVTPLVQAGPLGIRDDEYVTNQLLAGHALGSQTHMVYISSGYFNMTYAYIQAMMASPPEGHTRKQFNILTAAPEANGFFNSAGVSYWVPSAYIHIEREFLRNVWRNKLDDMIRVYEYVRPGWTFHAKGVWYYGSNDKLPSLTLIGSPNFGHRSVHRDLETQLMVTTSDKILQQRMDEERRWLFDGAQHETLASLEAHPSRRLRWWVPIVTRMIQTYF